MAHGLLRAASGFSLLIAATAAIALVVSYRYSVEITRWDERFTGALGFQKFVVRSGQALLIACDPSLVRHPGENLRDYTEAMSIGALGVHVMVDPDRNLMVWPTGVHFWGPGARMIGVPMWLLCMPPLAFSLSAAFVVRAKRRYRAQWELCRKCGYDLRASPDRCPECGAAALISRRRSPR